MAFLFIVVLVAGLFMFLMPGANAKVTRIGEMLLFSWILALLITITPAAVAKLFH